MKHPSRMQLNELNLLVNDSLGHCDGEGPETARVHSFFECRFSRALVSQCD